MIATIRETLIICSWVLHIRSRHFANFLAKQGDCVPPRTDSTEVFFSHRKIRCGLVHDHVLLREGLRRLLEDEPDIQVVSEAGNAAEGLRKVRELRPDVVVADSATFALPAAEAELLVARESPHTKIVFLSVQDQSGFPLENLRTAEQ